MGHSTLEDAIRSRRRVAGLTHSLYRYPARFTPEFARAAIEEFTRPDDWLLDPFVGGGTSAVEALAAGRRVAAIDINPIAILLTQAKTTPLYPRDVLALREWLTSTATLPLLVDRRLVNAPPEHVRVLAPLAANVSRLRTHRQQIAARALLIHVGQWALDGRETPVGADSLSAELDRALESHVAGISALTAEAAVHGIQPSGLLRRRIVRHGHTATVTAGRPWNRLTGRFRLVLTSPPYPSVHVLYHRWQVNGRAETPLAYWLSDLSDGLGESHYTMGGRRAPSSEEVYFRTIKESYSAMKRLLAPDARVVQLVSFNAPERQLSRYMDAMTAAGYEDLSGPQPTTREVPNRRWYYRVAPKRGNAREYLLIHRVGS